MSRPVYKQQAQRLADEVTDIESLLEKIIQKYPNELPQRLVSESHVSRLVGQQDVVNYIRGIINQIHNA